jgi:nitroimidazol reductase NimA-like FMN-containing flavoprotein (pyridoxamine 5'-phosphate oxidase superfamily)
VKRYAPTEKTRVRRLPKRAHYDVETVYAILDAGFICHVGYVIDRQPYVTPTAYWREGDHVYWHGSHASRMLDRAPAHPVCLTVTHLDALVVARSGFHHSINYRSAMIFGTPSRVDDEDAKRRAMERFVERIYPGRWSGLRPVTRKELKATTVLSMPIEEASAKIRIGGPIDDEPDYALPIWAGIVPIQLVHGMPVADERLRTGIAPPQNVCDFPHLGLRPGRR